MIYSRRHVHAAVCILLCTAFVALSARRVWSGLTVATFAPMGPFQTTDRDIAGLSGLQNGSERIILTLAALPRGKKFVLVLKEGDAASIYFALMVGYLAWPREVVALQVTAQNAAALVRPLTREALAGYLFCRLPPPPFLPPGQEWAPGLIFVAPPETGTGEKQ